MDLKVTPKGSLIIEDGKLSTISSIEELYQQYLRIAMVNTLSSEVVPSFSLERLASEANEFKELLKSSLIEAITSDVFASDIPKNRINVDIAILPGGRIKVTVRLGNAPSVSVGFVLESYSGNLVMDEEKGYTYEPKSELRVVQEEIVAEEPFQEVEVTCEPAGPLFLCSHDATPEVTTIEFNAENFHNAVRLEDLQDTDIMAEGERLDISLLYLYNTDPSLLNSQTQGTIKTFLLSNLLKSRTSDERIIRVTPKRNILAIHYSSRLDDYIIFYHSDTPELEVEIETIPILYQCYDFYTVGETTSINKSEFAFPSADIRGRKAYNLGKYFGAGLYTIYYWAKVKTWYNGSMERFLYHPSGSGGGFGDYVINGANLGTGHGIFRDKVEGTLRFKSLRAGTSIVISSGPEEITIGIDPNANLVTIQSGGTGESLISSGSANNFTFRSIKAGTNISVTSNQSEVIISCPDAIVAGQNVGNGSEVLKDVSNNTMYFRKLVGTAGVEVTQNSDEVVIKGNENVVFYDTVDTVDLTGNDSGVHVVRLSSNDQKVFNLPTDGTTVHGKTFKFYNIGEQGTVKVVTPSGSIDNPTVTELVVPPSSFIELIAYNNNGSPIYVNRKNKATDYRSEVTYQCGDIVRHGGLLYIAKSDTVSNVEPDTDPTKWIALAASGGTGASDLPFSYGYLPDSALDQCTVYLPGQAGQPAIGSGLFNTAGLEYGVYGRLLFTRGLFTNSSGLDIPDDPSTGDSTTPRIEIPLSIFSPYVSGQYMLLGDALVSSSSAVQLSRVETDNTLHTYEYPTAVKLYDSSNAINVAFPKKNTLPLEWRNAKITTIAFTATFILPDQPQGDGWDYA